MQRIKVVLSDSEPGKFASYIPVIFRHACEIEVERTIHSIPPRHEDNHAGMQKMLVDAARTNAEESDLIIISGGIDINPKIYGQTPHKYTDKIPHLSCRDEVEIAMINTALELDIPIIHICRGYQLALALLLKNVEPDILQFCQHLPDVSSGIHRSNYFKEGKELIYNAHYISNDFISDLKEGKKSPLISEKNALHIHRIFPGTITHFLYRKMLNLPADYNEPIDVEETSSHHQGFIINPEYKMPEGLIPSAISLAGDEVPILEGFESANHSLFMGVQWHFEANAAGNVGCLFRTITDYAEFRKNNKSVKFLEWSSSQA